MEVSLDANALLTFLGIVVTGLTALLVEQIRTRRKAGDAASTSHDVLDVLTRLHDRLDAHIEWHLGHRRDK